MQFQSAKQLTGAILRMDVERRNENCQWDRIPEPINQEPDSLSGSARQNQTTQNQTD